MGFSSSTYQKLTIISSCPPSLCLLSTCISYFSKYLLIDFLAVSPLSNSAYIFLLEILFKNANLSMSSCKILLRFSIAFRIKLKFYKAFKTHHLPIRALFSAISEYLLLFKYITFPLASCLFICHYVCMIIFFPESPGLALTYTSSCRFDCS